MDEGLFNSILGFINESITDKNLNITRLCTKQKCSRNALYQKFLNTFDMTVKKYIEQKRLCKSIKLMNSKNNRLWKECGFSSANIFSRTFKRNLGITKSDFHALLKEYHEKEDVVKEIAINCLMNKLKFNKEILLRKTIQKDDSERRFRKTIQKDDSERRFRKTIQKDDLERRFRKTIQIDDYKVLHVLIFYFVILILYINKYKILLYSRNVDDYRKNKKIHILISQNIFGRSVRFLGVYEGD